MYHANDGFLSATTEIMTVHVDLNARKVAPMPAAIQEKAADLFAVHRDLPAPEQMGRAIGIRKK
jgi:acyl-CoA thioester hydrolase